MSRDFSDKETQRIVNHHREVNEFRDMLSAEVGGGHGEAEMRRGKWLKKYLDPDTKHKFLAARDLASGDYEKASTTSHSTQELHDLIDDGVKAGVISSKVATDLKKQIQRRRGEATETQPAFSRQGQLAPGRGTDERIDLAHALKRARQAVRVKAPQALEATSKKNLKNIVAAPVERKWNMDTDRPGAVYLTTKERELNYTHIDKSRETPVGGILVPVGKYVFKPHRKSDPNKWAKEAYVQKHMDDLQEQSSMLSNASGLAYRAGIRTDKRKARIENLSGMIHQAKIELDKRRPMKNKNRMTDRTYDIVGKLRG